MKKFYLPPFFFCLLLLLLTSPSAGKEEVSVECLQRPGMIRCFNLTGIDPVYKEIIPKKYINIYDYMRWVDFYQSLEVGPGDTLLLGDSHVRMYPWGETLGATRVVNMGINGDFSTGVLRRFKGLGAVRPGLVLIQMGQNDFRYRNSVARLLENYSLLVSHIRSQSKGARILVMGIPPVNTELRRDEDLNAVIVQANGELEKKCRDWDVEFIDISGALSDSKGQLDIRYTLDGVHLNAKGFDVLVDLVRRRAGLSKEPQTP